MKAQQDYASQTIKSNDPLRNLSHNARLDLALRLCSEPSHAHVLDFGGGDGAFLIRLKDTTQARFQGVLFEPYMDATQIDGIRIERDWEGVQQIAADNAFDLVSCQEVMEHFAPHRQTDALERIASVLKPNGRFVCSVPVEVGPVALIKNIGRWKYRKNEDGKQIYSYSNLIRSFSGIPIPATRTGDGYLSHMGFYYNDFRRVLEKHFRIEQAIGSPYSALPLLANSQVFFVCSKR